VDGGVEVRGAGVVRGAVETARVVVLGRVDDGDDGDEVEGVGSVGAAAEVAAAVEGTTVRPARPLPTVEVAEQPAPSTAAASRAAARVGRAGTTAPPSHGRGSGGRRPRRLESTAFGDGGGHDRRADERGGAVAQRGGQFGGGQPNMQQLMKQAQKMQAQLAAAQAELAESEVTGTAGGGLVTATLNGSGELTAIAIDPRAVDPDDVETLQDLVVAAVRDAHRAVSELANEKMGPLTSGLGGLGGGLGLPGL
jgi:DNA-binding YbaB/EbfC family protein